MTEAQWKIAYERVEEMTQEQLIWMMKQIRKKELEFENAQQTTHQPGEISTQDRKNIQ